MQFKNWEVRALPLIAFVALLAAYVVLRVTHNEVPTFILDPLVLGGMTILAFLKQIASKQDATPVVTDTPKIVPFLIALACARWILACSGSGGAPTATAVDVGTYEADQIACVEREDSDKCHADKVACRARIDACRADVKKRYGR